MELKLKIYSQCFNMILYLKDLLTEDKLVWLETVKNLWLSKEHVVKLIMKTKRNRKL
jgi:hypothetical protein